MKVALIGAGEMGAAVGATLVEHGAQVVSPLEGRSAQTHARAAAAGMRDASLAECARCDFALSIVASSQALPVAQAFAALPDRGGMFVDCNAIDPAKVREIDALFGGAGFADAGIVGPPPDPAGSRAPTFYVSGADAHRVLALADYGLAFEHLEGPPGAASALKLCFAGASKGQSALLAMLTLLAAREGVQDAFLAQLAKTNAGFLAWGGRQAQRLGTVSARWAEEMEEIEHFAAGVPGAAEEFAALARFYAALAQAPAQTASLKDIFSRL